MLACLPLPCHKRLNMCLMSFDNIFYKYSNDYSGVILGLASFDISYNSFHFPLLTFLRCYYDVIPYWICNDMIAS